MSKKIIYLLLCLTFVSGICSCGIFDEFSEQMNGSEHTVVQAAEDAIGIYWMNLDETKIVKEDYTIDTTSVETIIESSIAGLQATPGDNAYKSVLTSAVNVQGYTYDGSDKYVTLYFSETYRQQAFAREVLTRAAIVKTLTQFSDDIRYVSFVIGSEALTDASGKILKMQGKDFVNSISGNMEYTCEDYVTLYFANEEGTMLKSEDVVIKYQSKINLETAIVNSLIAGPLNTNLQAVLSSDTKVNKVYLKEGICYVDLDDTFFERQNDQKFKLNVYAIVDTLTQLSDVSGVQFLIDGSVYNTSVDGIRIDSVFEQDMSIVSLPDKEYSEDIYSLDKTDLLNKDIEHRITTSNEEELQTQEMEE